MRLQNFLGWIFKIQTLLVQQRWNIINSSQVKMRANYNSQIMQKYLGEQFICQEHQEPLNLVCLDQKCPAKGMICAYCEYKQHHHPVRALSSLFFEVDRDMKTYETALCLMSQIDQAFVLIQQQSKKIANASDKKIVQEMISNYHNHNASTLFKRSKLASELLDSKRKTIKDVNEFILRYNFIDKEFNPDQYSNSQYQFRTKLEQLKNGLKDFKQSIKNGDSLDKIINIFSIQDEKKTRYFFNSEKSHRDIIIVDKIKAELKDGYSYRIALLDPPIRKEGGKSRKKTITFRIHKATAMVGVGIVYKKKIQGTSYTFSAYSQHGCYFVTNSGYTYNQSNPSFNSQIKNWNFTTNDVVKVSLWPKEKKVMFEKEGKDPFQMPFDDKPELELYFGVLLCQKDDSAEVIFA